MKVHLCWILILALLLTFSGCNTNGGQHFEKPVNFYYCLNFISYEDPSGVIGSEIRESAGYENDIVSLLETYLDGPVGNQFVSPFPENITIEHYNDDTHKVQIVLSKDMASLFGVNLTIACICLGRTIIELTGTQSVQVSFESNTSGVRNSITITPDSYLLTDITPIPE